MRASHRVLFVCAGNICRSPTAAGVFRTLAARAGVAERYQVDSAGVHAYRQDLPPDARAIKVAAGRGFDIAGSRSRLVVPADFATFDLIAAMDRDNLGHLRYMCPPPAAARLQLFMSFVPGASVQDVPDPYCGEAGFERVFDLIEAGCRGLLGRLESGTAAN